MESRVLSADPIELIHILYEHTLGLVQDARCHLAAGDISARGKAISRAIDALAELDSSLDHEAGGSISRNLAGLYQYMRMRLLTANIRRQDAPLAEVESLLKTLSEAWSAIRPAAQAVTTAPVAASNAWGGPFAPQGPEYTAPGWSA